MRETKPGLGGPMGKGDFEKGRRLAFLLEQAPRLQELGWVPMFEIKGDDVSGGWVEELYYRIKPWGGILTWHWSVGSTKKLGDPAEPISEKLRMLAANAWRLKTMVKLAAVTIHCAPAVSVEPPLDAYWQARYDSPINAEEMSRHIWNQAEPLKELNKLCGGILQIENVEITNLRDEGFKLPTYLALQTGSWWDLISLAQWTGVGVTFDCEHHLCTANVLLRRREMARLSAHYPRACARDTISQSESLFAGTGYVFPSGGYWLSKGRPPCAPRLDETNTLERFVTEAKPWLFHLAGAVQAFNEAGEICTHLPYDQGDEEQMRLLDWQLAWILANDNCLGAVTEVTGQLYVDDPANPGHNRYSPWSPRTADDETAKEEAILTIIDRLERLQTPTI